VVVADGSRARVPFSRAIDEVRRPACSGAEHGDAGGRGWYFMQNATPRTLVFLAAREFAEIAR
jgi:hypothetical protein